MDVPGGERNVEHFINEGLCPRAGWVMCRLYCGSGLWALLLVRISAYGSCMNGRLFTGVCFFSGFAVEETPAFVKEQNWLPLLLAVCCSGCEANCSCSDGMGSHRIRSADQFGRRHVGFLLVYTKRPKRAFGFSMKQIQNTKPAKKHLWR